MPKAEHTFLYRYRGSDMEFGLYNPSVSNETLDKWFKTWNDLIDHVANAVDQHDGSLFNAGKCLNEFIRTGPAVVPRYSAMADYVPMYVKRRSLSKQRTGKWSADIRVEPKDRLYLGRKNMHGFKVDGDKLIVPRLGVFVIKGFERRLLLDEKAHIIRGYIIRRGNRLSVRFTFRWYNSPIENEYTPSEIFLHCGESCMVTRSGATVQTAEVRKNWRRVIRVACAIARSDHQSRSYHILKARMRIARAGYVEALRQQFAQAVRDTGDVRTVYYVHMSERVTKSFRSGKQDVDNHGYVVRKLMRFSRYCTTRFAREFAIKKQAKFVNLFDEILIDNKGICCGDDLVKYPGSNIYRCKGCGLDYTPRQMHMELRKMVSVMEAKARV